MIMVGNSRANGQELARHLLSPENEHVTIHAIDGFVANDLHGAFLETESYSRGTRCRKYLYSLSLNPPANEIVSTEVFEDAIDTIEQTLGLVGQPKAIVFHEKLGADGLTRRHCHVVWSRIDTQQMKAIQLDFPKRKLRDISISLYVDNGWDMPKGFIDPKFRNPTNFSLAEWQQAKRQGQDPREIKAIFQSCWKQSDNKQSFANALKEHGYILARGDRRAHVATDINGKIFNISKWTGLKTKEVKTRLGDKNTLPSVSEAQRQLANDCSLGILRLQQEQRDKLTSLQRIQRRQRKSLTARHVVARKNLQTRQDKQRNHETRIRQERFNKGLRGLFDRFTGTHSTIKKRNEMETYRAHLRDQNHRDDLIFQQIEEKRRLERKHIQANKKTIVTQSILQQDMERLKTLRDNRAPNSHSRNNGPEYEI